MVMDEQLPASSAAIIQRLPEPERHEVVAAVRAGRNFTTEELRSQARTLRRPVAATARDGDGTSRPDQATDRVVNSLASESPNGHPLDSIAATEPGDRVVNSLPPGAVSPDPQGVIAATGGRLRPALVTLNNLAREIEAFCDRHDAGGFTEQEAAPLARAAARLVAHLQGTRRT